MMPPLNSRESGVEVLAPLHRWELLASFDTAAECQSAFEHNIVSNIATVEQLQARHERCIATNDPRLTAQQAGRHCD